MVFDSAKISTSNNIPIQIKYFLGATFNVSTSMKSIESPLSDVIQNDLQSRKEDRRSPSLSNFSSDKDKLSLGKVLYDCNFFQNNSARLRYVLFCHVYVINTFYRAGYSV